nr:hypothetical protein B0A51_13245 [Rachicladosporium sp. CCFEE 5018]
MKGRLSGVAITTSLIPHIFAGSNVAYVLTVSVAHLGPDSVYLVRPNGDNARHIQPPDDNSDKSTATSRPSLTRYDSSDIGVGTEGEKRGDRSEGVKRSFRRIMAAVAHAPRPYLRRNSPLATHRKPIGYTVEIPVIKHLDVSDSDSDDEPPPFSKFTEALLKNGPVPSSPPRQQPSSAAKQFVRSVSAPKNLDTPSRPAYKIIRKSSPSALGSSQGVNRGHTPPRIVHIGSGQKGSGRRTISIGGPYPKTFGVKRDPTPQPEVKPEIVTPAPAPRAIRVTRIRTGSNASQDAHIQSSFSTSRPGSRDGHQPSSDQQRPAQLAMTLSRHTSLHHAPETASRYAPSTVSRSRNASAEVAPPPGSIRIKRAPMTGTFLKSGPVRRGFRRRDSEENVSPADDYQSGSASANTHFTPSQASVYPDGARSRSGSVNTRATSEEPISVHDYALDKNTPYEARPASRQAASQLSRSQISQDSRPPSRQASHELLRSRQLSAERAPPLRQPSAPPADSLGSSDRVRSPSDDHPPAARPVLEQRQPQRAPSLRQQQHRYLPPIAYAADGQENMPPPTFRRNKDQDFKAFGRPALSIMSDDDKPKIRPVEETPVPVPAAQQERRALGAISGNTPHRAAPAPPPKMSVLETATATGGAGTTKSRRKRSHVVLKGKIFTQMSRLGKGGSSDVYCVMAENFKTFALKKVKLDDLDENTVTGYKGEIDLLKSLSEVERVVRLIDWELNDSKQELLVLMEKGDTDFNRVLTMKIATPEAKLDSVFIRYHWREMLECVAAVHEHDIVHSDLKPANFLLVQGRLKLIDFGIANAIDTDNTVNVHRESNVGTPNYMSPESITDTNTGSAVGSRDAHGRIVKKDMVIGKASDVWSLGCILYQMTYGRPPFAHIPNQIARIMAITNTKVAIEFPDTGIGGAAVPASLKGTLRRCLQRDPNLRPTAQNLLSEGDAFLNPEAGGAVVMTEDLLLQIIGKVVERCKATEKGFPSEDEWRTYPRSFIGKFREMVEKG